MDTWSYYKPLRTFSHVLLVFVLAKALLATGKAYLQLHWIVSDWLPQWEHPFLLLLGLCGRQLLVALTCILLLTGEVEHFFLFISHLYFLFPLMCYSGPSPFSQLKCLSFSYWLAGVLSMFWILALCWLCVLQISSALWLAFLPF